MKKQATKRQQESTLINAGKDTTSRVLLVAAIILYSASLILLANLALAGTSTTVGALIKVNNQLDGDAFDELNADVKSVSGNVLMVNVPGASVASMSKVKGICSTQLDHNRTEEQTINADHIKEAFAGSGAVIGMLDNKGQLSQASINGLKKVEASANVGFISYVTDNPNSTVIMRNINGGESNLIQALLYMDEYAKTVEKPLIVELNVGAEELNNPLFVQVCQKFAEAGVQFLGADVTAGSAASSAPIQMAFSMFNAATGQISDRSDFWSIREVKQQQIMLLGSDNETCSIFFQTEAGFDKVYMSNGSEDMVMVTAITADGSVNYYHVVNKETALIPRTLRNGTPVLEDGLTGLFPFHSKGTIFNGAVSDQQFVTLKNVVEDVQLNAKNGLNMTIGSPEARTLAMSLDNISPNLKIEVTDEAGEMVYRSQPDIDTQSIKTKIDLSSGDGGLYFLDLTSPDFHQTFALQMD